MNLYLACQHNGFRLVWPLYHEGICSKPSSLDQKLGRQAGQDQHEAQARSGVQEGMERQAGI